MKQVTDFLIDNSDEMDKKEGLLKNVLSNELVPNFDCNSVFGFRTFASICGSPIIIKQLDLKEPNTKSDLDEKANKIPIPGGGAPLAVTLRESLEELNDIEGDVKKIIVISAGKDTEGGNIEFEAARAAGNVQINFIGIGMDEYDLRAAEKVASMTNGACCNIPEDKFNDSFAIHTIVAPVVDAMKNLTVAAQPAVKVEVKPASVAQEVKEEKKVVANAQQEAVAAPKVELSKVEINTVDYKQKAAEIQSVSVAASAPAESFDAVAALSSANQSIIELLQANEATLKQVLKNGEATIQENAELRKAEAQNLANIEQLKEINVASAQTIEELKAAIADKQKEAEAAIEKLQAEFAAETARLKQIITNKDNEISALETSKENMQEAIDQLIKSVKGEE